MSTLKIELAGDLKKQLEQFAKDLQGEVLTSAVAAGAKVLYDELQVRVPVDDGQLKSAVYRYMDRETEKQPNRTYFVGVNMAKAPHWWLVEYGHMQSFQVIKTKNKGWKTLKKRPLPAPRFVPGSPYLRPTADAKLAEALEVVKKRFGQKIQEFSK